MTDTKLSSLSEQIQRELAHRKSRQIILTKIKKDIENSGYSIEDILGATKPTTKKVAPKFRHKEDSSLTWSGRGRMPKWIKKYGVKI